MSLDRRQLLLAGAGAGLAAATPALAASADAALTTRLDGLAEDILRRQPEAATSWGVDKGARAGLKSKLADRSWASVTSMAAMCGEQITALKAIPDAGLGELGQINKAVALYALELGRDGGKFDYGDNTLLSAMAESATPYVVNQQNGAYVSAAEFLDSQHQIETKADADAYVDRLRALAVQLDQETARVTRDAGHGVIAPDFILANAIGQMTNALATQAAASRYVTSVAGRAKAKGIAGDYAGQATKIVEGDIYPALARQQAALRAAAAKAGSDAGVWRLPDGEAYYAWMLRQGTNTELSAGEIHELGLVQNKAIEARMDGVLKANGLTQGSVGERMIALGDDPRFQFPDTDAGRAQILAYLDSLIADMRPRLAGQFNLKLKAPVLVKRVPVEIQDGAGQGYMNFGSLDGARPSIYYVNLKTTKNWPRFTLPTLTAHEAIPGHAWQGAYLTETGQLPLIRNLLGGFNAYVEGWALYAEQLGDEMGMYKDDWAGQLGYLQGQRFRAIRLVVDTGLHAKRWTRDQAIDWAVRESGRTRASMTSEIDRYISTPGQACGYKVGHNEINRLRDHARTALGPKFDIRGFNDTVVKTGAVPMSVLAGQVEALIARGGKA
ncbi:DUF885 domain-containing protein [Phenylobacterium sp.]|uniref:DUF885 domain-containing protein n=1 Tax=Phenylobacterium sp. TaxID=1871053 RepID=UPI003BAD5D1E